LTPTHRARAVNRRSRQREPRMQPDMRHALPSAESTGENQAFMLPQTPRQGNAWHTSSRHSSSRAAAPGVRSRQGHNKPQHASLPVHPPSYWEAVRWQPLFALEAPARGGWVGGRAGVLPPLPTGEWMGK